MRQMFGAISIFTVTIFTTLSAEIPSFKVYHIHEGGGKGGTSLVDIDKDGDLDWVVCPNWYEYQSAQKWVKHDLGRCGDVGGMAFHVDDDGWIDYVAGGYVNYNPKKPKDEKFESKGFFNPKRGGHDVVGADIDKDGKKDVLVLKDNYGLSWYKNPGKREPGKRDEKWIETMISTRKVHGGVDPAGFGDLDGDGDVDIVNADRWYQNKDGKGKSWSEKQFPGFGVTKAHWIMTKTIVIDLDRDGDLDIVQSEGDATGGEMGWVENKGKANSWKRHVIMASGHSQDLHSLCVNDFDGDKDPDIFTCGGPKGERGSEREWYIFENTNGKASSWKKHVIAKGPRCHEAKCADVDGDGDIDIASKPWSGPIIQYYAENQAKKPKPTPVNKGGNSSTKNPLVKPSDATKVLDNDKEHKVNGQEDQHLLN